MEIEYMELQFDNGCWIKFIPYKKVTQGWYINYEAFVSEDPYREVFYEKGMDFFLPGSINVSTVIALMTSIIDSASKSKL